MVAILKSNKLASLLLTKFLRRLVDYLCVQIKVSVLDASKKHPLSHKMILYATHFIN